MIREVPNFKVKVILYELYKIFFQSFQLWAEQRTVEQSYVNNRIITQDNISSDVARVPKVKLPSRATSQTQPQKPTLRPLLLGRELSLRPPQFGRG